VNPDPALQFGPYRVDPGTAQIWKDRDRLHLTPKALSVLLHLIRERPRVVGKNELLDAVWPDVHVGEAVLKVAVREIRKALGDEAKQAVYVETAHRRGYRFLAPVTFVEGPRAGALPARRGDVAPALRRPTDAREAPLVGRDASLERLDAAFALAARGRRQLVFVSGEAGIGKTSIAEAFLAGAERDHGAWVARGQSVEHSTAQEPYLAVLDAFGRLLKQSGRSQVEAVLRRYAPTWVAQLPVLSSDGHSLQRETLGATPERMLREIAEALEALTADVMLILFLDDLHWADEATVDFVNLVARRSEPSRLLLIVTYRPADLALGPPALKTVRQDLQGRGLCQDIALDLLTRDDTEAYLDARFDAHAFPDGFARFLHGLTDGNPLFLTNLLAHLVRERILDEVGGSWTLVPGLEHIADAVPDSLRQLVDAMVARLGENEQRALEAASVSGAEFTAAAVAAAVAVDTAGKGRRVARYPGGAPAVCPQQRRQPFARWQPVWPLRLHALALSARALPAYARGGPDAAAPESRAARGGRLRGPGRRDRGGSGIAFRTGLRPRQSHRIPAAGVHQCDRPFRQPRSRPVPRTRSGDDRGARRARPLGSTARPAPRPGPRAPRHG
jgi:DNA-binding winged helix-turn-helix (wHTH) protein